MMKKSKYAEFSLYAAAVLITAVLFVIIWSRTGQWFWSQNPYNSYMLQAKSWLEGRLDLGRNYEYLELAIFGGKYYVSFPPFPSYLMLPFALLGIDRGDGFIAFASSLAGVVFALMIARHFIKSRPMALLMALFVTIGSNWLFCAANAWVWFIAQNLAFTLSMAALYFAVKGKAGLSLTFWACAVGCRPFQAIYIVLLLYLIYREKKALSPEDTPMEMIKKNIKCLIAPFLIAVSYMVLNYARFGSITEFGHNYLPEFTRVSTGQFNIAYFKTNFPHFWRLPFENGKINFFTAEGFCIFIASPIFISYVCYTLKGFIKGKDRAMLSIILICFICHLVFIALHKTMGGSHIGNRYTNDILPFIYLAVVFGAKGKISYLNALPFAAGAGLNIWWNIAYYTNNIPW